MGKQEILCTPIGEMYDMIACLSISNGSSQQKVKTTMQDLLMKN